MTKLEKAEQSADNLVTKVLTDQAKRRAESAEIEKKRLELAIQTEEREAERDRQFMQQMQQMMALMIQSVRTQSYPPPAPFPMGYQPGPGYPPAGQPGLGYSPSSQPGPRFYPGTFIPTNPPLDMSIPPPANTNPDHSSPEENSDFHARILLNSAHALILLNSI